jgi:hypothetical protein
LGVYCEVEAMLNRATRLGTATSAMLTAHRQWAGEFYDTPASQRRAPASGPAGDNPFRRNGAR